MKAALRACFRDELRCLCAFWGQDGWNAGVYAAQTDSFQMM